MKTFISYRSLDLQFAEQLYTDLTESGLSIWMDQHDIPYGRKWDRVIDEALQECDQMVVLLSPSAIESDNVWDEWSFFLEEGKLVIPIILSKCRIPVRLRRLHHINFAALGYDAGLAELKAALNGGQTPPEDDNKPGNYDNTEDGVDTSKIVYLQQFFGTAGSGGTAWLEPAYYPDIVERVPLVERLLQGVLSPKAYQETYKPRNDVSSIYGNLAWLIAYFVRLIANLFPESKTAIQHHDRFNRPTVDLIQFAEKDHLTHTLLSGNEFDGGIQEIRLKDASIPALIHYSNDRIYTFMFNHPAIDDLVRSNSRLYISESDDSLLIFDPISDYECINKDTGDTLFTSHESDITLPVDDLDNVGTQQAALLEAERIVDKTFRKRSGYADNAHLN